MLLYQPTAEEIAVTLRRAASRAPSLRSRLDRAGDLLRAGALHFEDGQWRCASLSGPDADPHADPGDPLHTYLVDFDACDCPDCRSRRALVGGVAFCKHMLALQALRSILLDHLHAHLVGDLTDAQAKAQARQAPNAALLLSHGVDPRRPAVFAFANARHLRPLCICSLLAAGNNLAFASEGHMGVFAEWLRRAQPLPPTLEALMLYRRLRALGFADDDAAAAADEALVPAGVPLAA